MVNIKIKIMFNTIIVKKSITLFVLIILKASIKYSQHVHVNVMYIFMPLRKLTINTYVDFD